MAKGDPEVLRFRTRDPDHFSERMSLVVPDVRAQPYRKNAFEMAMRIHRLPGAVVFMGRPSHAELSHPPEGELAITVTVDGEFEVLENGRIDSYPAGSAYLGNGDRDFQFRVPRSASVLVFKTDARAFRHYPRRLSADSTPARPECGPLSLRCTEGAALWRNLCLVWRELSQGAALSRSPVAALETEDALTALLHSVFIRQATQPREDDGAAPVKRAEDYMMANLGEPVLLADLTEAAGVSASTLLRSFAKHRGNTPMALLRQRRLDAVHRVLLTADPREGLVTETALRFGFAHLGRFAGEYRQSFGERPSETLRARTGLGLHLPLGGSFASGDVDSE